MKDKWNSIRYNEGRFIDDNVDEQFMREIYYDRETGKVIYMNESPYSRGDCTKGSFKFYGFDYMNGYQMF